MDTLRTSAPPPPSTLGLLDPASPKVGMDTPPREPLLQALEHRFRHTLRSGQVSPLLHLVWRYQQEAQTCKSKA